MKNAIAVILGGGRGRRLLPLTEMRCKPAVPVGGSYRLVDIPISNCINADIRRIFVLTQYQSASLNRHIAQTYTFDSFSNGFVDILAADQTMEGDAWYQGAADAVRRNLETLDNYPECDVVVMNGDILFRLDLEKVVDYHRTRSADVTLVLSPFALEEAGRFGVAKVDTHTRLTDYVEKPDVEMAADMLAERGTLERFRITPKEPAALASMGIYVFRPGILKELLAHAEDMDFGKNVLPRAVHSRKVFGFLFDGYWRDLGTIASFYEANLDLTRSIPAFSFYDARLPIYTRPRFLPPTKLMGCEIDNALMSDGCFVRGASISESIIGVRSIIREGARVERSVLMGADFYDSQGARTMQGDLPELGLGEGAVVRGAIIDKNARLGRDCRIVNEQGRKEADDALYAIHDGIVIIRKNAVIPPGMVI